MLSDRETYLIWKSGGEKITKFGENRKLAEKCVCVCIYIYEYVMEEKQTR